MSDGTRVELMVGVAPAARAAGSDSLWREAGRRFLRHRLALTGAVILVLMVTAVLIGPLVYRVPIDAIDFKAKLKGPSWAHPLGTDDLGQDLLARMLYGGRISLAVGVAAMLIAITLGTLVGAVAGHVGGTVDNALMRVTDLFLSLPALPLLLLVVYCFATLKALGRGRLFVLIVFVMAASAVPAWRAQFLSPRRIRGGRGPWGDALRQIARHTLPNAVGPVIVAASLDVAAAILQESTLSFLGLGFPPDIPTWGRILSDAKDNLDFAPHWALFAGTAIFLTVLSINYIGDGLRDALAWVLSLTTWEPTHNPPTLGAPGKPGTSIRRLRGSGRPRIPYVVYAENRTVVARALKSVMTLTTAGLPDAHARSSARRISLGFSTNSPWAPSSFATLS
jgi:peptide/nickel transport system permease protein